ncbi:Rv1157c family protein [Mycolicibacter minnesotensis]
MSRLKTLFATTHFKTQRATAAKAVVAAGSSAVLVFGSLGLASVATADPAMPALPLPTAGFPGLPAIEQLSPVIQQAAADPAGATSLLMAAAAAFTGNSNTPANSRQVADSVAQFVQSPPEALPSNHVPTAGSAPGLVAHLPSGVDPAKSVGPAPQAAPNAPEALPAPAEALPDAAPAAPEAAFIAPAPDAATAATAATPGFGPDAPPTQDFMYPSIGQNCQADGGNVIATALSVAGPATIPTPGPKPGQTAYVFTAMGTPGPAETQKLPLNVTWVNLTTGKSGSATLQPRTDINPEGPTTLTAIVDTGSGSIMSTIFGQVSTKDHQCNFLPTIGSTVVP